MIINELSRERIENTGLWYSPLHLSSNFSWYTFNGTNIVLSDGTNHIIICDQFIVLLVICDEFYVSLNVYWRKLENRYNEGDLNPENT